MASAGVGRYPNFDILRLLLAVEVAFVHAWAMIDSNFGWPGYIMAVPAFLAISGFLVLKSYEETGSWALFIRKRALRIFPALLLSFLLCLAILGPRTAATAVLTWISGGLYTSWGPLWSLAWEELAYLGLAALWALGAYKRPAIIWGLLIASLLLNGAVSSVTPAGRIILFLPVTFFIGNLMYVHRAALLTVGPIVPWIALYVAIQWKYVPDSKLFHGAMLAALQSFAVVWAGMAGLRLQPIRIPDLSYGIYVYHMPIILALYEYGGVRDFWTMMGTTTLLVVPVAAASWYLIERPALRLKIPERTAGAMQVASPS